MFVFRSKYSKDKCYYKALNKIFGIYPNNIELYKLALIHKSASVVLEDGMVMNNERLEYLGDAVIESIVSDMLYIDFPFEDEGFLTQLRSRIVSRNSLNELAKRIGLDDYVIAQNNQANVRKNIHGDAFEAMIGALYLDKGYDFTNRLLINKLIRRYIDIENLLETETDYKSRLIEWGQKNRKMINIDSKQSETRSEEDSFMQFNAIISIGGTEAGYGIGSSKKEAEQRAAKNAIESFGITI